MNIVKATAKYEAWLAKQITIIPADLRTKHELMRVAPFPFFRATFYRWAQTWPEISPETVKAVEVLGVGDLHVENFGTWRDADGRLIWGINDFDEACPLPYTCDLVRLATSAHLAIAGDHLKMITPEQASVAILEGYNACLAHGGEPFVLAEKHLLLRQMAVERLKQPDIFWGKIEALKTQTSGIAATAAKALKRMMPDPKLPYRIAHRVAGMGSLGRRRYIAIANWHGGMITREAKELCSSAWIWAHSGRSRKISYNDVLRRAIRCADPFVELRDGWILRRLAPDCSRIELSSLPTRHDAVRLLHAMGWETANVHLGSVKPRVLQKDLAKRKAGWLNLAAESMFESTSHDWQAWRKASGKPPKVVAL